jgi:ABC-2 type transport system permease protein
VTGRLTTARATELVVERELREAFRRRSLWIVFAILFLGSCAAMVLPDLLGGGKDRYDVAVVDTGDAAQFEGALASSLHAQDATVTFRPVTDLARARRQVDRGNVDLAVMLGDDPVVIARSGNADVLVVAARQAIASSALDARLQAAGVDPSTLDVPSIRLVNLEADEGERRANAFVLSLVVYLVLLLLMTQAASGVAIEKANRISEVLLAVVKPGALLFGKVVGVGIVGLAGITVAAVPVVVKAAVGGDLPAGLGGAVAGSVVWFVLGLAVYLTIAGSLGALVERQEEVGSVIAPLSLLLVATYVFATSASESGLGTFLAVFPLTSPIVMPAQIALGEATAGEMVASLALGVATVAVIVRLGGAVYRRGIVHTGRRLRLGEALRAG